MNGFLALINRQNLAMLFCAMLMTSMVYSPFLLSVSMIALAAIIVFQVDWVNGKVKVGFNPEFGRNLKRWWSHPAFMIVTVYFFLVLFSGVFSEDFVYWGHRLRLKLPFLVLPFIFISIPKFSERQYLSLFYFLLFMLTVTSIGVGINYLLNFEEINIMLKKGQPMPTPRNHIRFSLLLALGIISGGYLFEKNFYIKWPTEKWFILGMILFLFFFIHLLSVRSGIVALYICLAFLILRYIYFQKQYVLGGLLLALLAFLPWMAYQMIPSFKAKLAYVRYDLKMHQSGKGGDNSDSARLTSLKIGMQIGNEHPIVGVGAGDLKKEVYKIYAAEYPEIKEPRMPHNQFISVYAGMGVIGLGVFILTLLFPLFYQKNYQDPIFLSFHLIVIFSFMMENTIENSIGIAFYAFFLLLGLNHLSGIEKQSSYTNA